MWPFFESPIESHIWQSRLYMSPQHNIVILMHLRLYKVFINIVNWNTNKNTQQMQQICSVNLVTSQL